MIVNIVCKYVQVSDNEEDPRSCSKEEGQNEKLALVFGPKGVLIHALGTTLDLLSDRLQFGSLLDSHLDFLLSLKYFFDVLVHHHLKLLQLLVEHFLLVRVLVAIEECLSSKGNTNCCL